MQAGQGAFVNKRWKLQKIEKRGLRKGNSLNRRYG